MQNLSELLVFVNEQTGFHKSKSDEYREKVPKRSERHLATSLRFEELKALLVHQDAEISRLKNALDNVPKLEPLKGGHLSLSLEDIKDLPEELLKELSVSDGDRFDYMLQSILQDGGGVMSLDQFLVALYRKTGEIHKRATVNARLYKLSQRDVLFAVPGKKGAYAIRPLSDDEAEKIG